MASPSASTDSSSLSPPPSTLSSPSPEPDLLSPPSSPAPPTRGKPKSASRKQKKDPQEKKQKKKEKKDGNQKITIKLKQMLPKAEKEKKPLAKPREPKIEPIPRSLVNNSDVPLVVLFRGKFRSLFSGTSELGPQDVEEGVSVEGDLVGKLEEFVMRACMLIGNRKKPVEYTPSWLELTVDESSWGRCCRRLSTLVMRSMDFEGVG